jgi:hypothetical protein
MKAFTIGLSLLIMLVLVSSGKEFKTLISDVEFDLLNGKNVTLFICKANQITLNTPLTSAGMNGFIAIGQSGRALIKQNIKCQKILYISPSIAFGMSNGNFNKLKLNAYPEISEVWIEVENFGADLVFISPFENLESNLVVAESLQIDNKFILLVRQIKPELYAQKLSQAISIRKKNDDALIMEAKKLIDVRIGKSGDE